MRKGTDKLLFMAAAFAGVTGLSVNALHADADSRRSRTECTVSVRDTIVVRSGTQDLQVSTTDSLADPVTGSIDMGAKITISAVTREAETNTHRLTIDATEAVPGDWKVTLRSGMIECAGTATVKGSADTKRF